MRQADENFHHGIKNCVHDQFLCDEFQGDAYAYPSSWLSRMMTGRESIFIPIYVPKLISDERFRKELGIPEDAKVSAGMAGGTLLISPFAWKAAVEHARNYTEDHFVFLNTEPIRGSERFLNIHYFSATVNPVEKAKILASCDAMSHTRLHG